MQFIATQNTLTHSSLHTPTHSHTLAVSHTHSISQGRTTTHTHRQTQRHRIRLDFFQKPNLIKQIIREVYKILSIYTKTF